MEHMTLRLKNISSLFVVSIIYLLSACSGGGGGGGDDNNAGTDNPNNNSQPLNADQIAFSESVFPIVRDNCSQCHSETGSNPDLVQFAHSDVAIAHSVVKNRGFVNLQSPSSSRFVARLNGEHNCWTNCDADAATMTNAISQWSGSVNAGGGNNGGGTGGGSGVASVEAFKQSLHPLEVENCATCHGDDGPYAKFAASDPQEAHDIILDKNLVKFNAPSSSALVTFLSERRHNCGTPANCDVLAVRTEALIVDWRDSIAEPPTGLTDNTPPRANNDNFSTTVNLPLLTGNVLLNDSDVDNDTLGISGFDATTTQGGFVQNNLNGTFTYTPASGFVGLDTFSYTVSDGKSGSAKATVSINVIQNVAPIALRDLIKTNQNTPVVIDTLLANDISGSGESLSVIFVDNLSVNGANVVRNADGSVTYTPPENFTGIDLFNYTVSDGQGTATAKVEVDVNTNPIAVSDAVYTYLETTANTGSVIVNDHDINGDSLSISSFDTASAQAGSVSSNGDGTFSYTPPDGFIGNDSFDYIVSDGRGGAATATVFISVINAVLADDDRFLAFLNQSAEVFQESAETATAYYRAVDPLDQRTTLEDWRILNGFNIGADAFALYINNNDLGFVRRMFVRTDPITGVISSYVENYATIQEALDEVNVIATVTMEYNVAPGRDPLDPDAPRYVSFYVYDGNDNRALSADLDGRGDKFVPGLCNVCHGGRPKALVGGIYPDNGDTGARHIPWDIDTFLFEDATGSVSRAAQEDQFKIFNQTVLDTDPLPAAKEVIEGWYGGPGLPANTFNGQFVPKGWLPPEAPAFATQLYTQAVAPACRACHIMRGSALQNDIDFATYDKFIGYKSRVEAMVFDEGTMPLALRTWDRFWENPILPETMARLMESSKILEDDEVLSPGRPVANAGPFREAALGRVDLNGNGSLFTGGANDFSWTLISRPAESLAVLQNANQADAFFIADVPGDYVAQLVVNDGADETPASPPAEVFIRVSGTTLRTSFSSDIKPIFDICAVCHLGFDNPQFNNQQTLYDNMIDFVNADDPVNSPILTKPSGQHHGGGTVLGFESSAGENYKTMLQWILEGAPDN